MRLWSYLSRTALSVRAASRLGGSQARPAAVGLDGDYIMADGRGQLGPGDGRATAQWGKRFDGRCATGPSQGTECEGVGSVL